MPEYELVYQHPAILESSNRAATNKTANIHAQDLPMR